MRRTPVLAAWLLFAAATPPPPPTPRPEPVVTVHRTAAAAHLDPGRGDPIFVLLIGSDMREGDPARGRADTIQILSVNPAANRGTLVGVPRDSFVDIPGIGTAKINEALYRGGPGKLVEAVQALSGITFHYWALIEFSRFRTLVDRLDGVEVNVPYAINEPKSGANFPPGPRRMNGPEALAFARVRYGIPGGDFGRSANQGTLLLAALAKFRAEAGDPLRLLQWLNAFRDLVATNVGPGDLLSLSLIGRRLDPAGVQSLVLPGRPGAAGSQSVVFLDPRAGEILGAVRDDGII